MDRKSIFISTIVFILSSLIIVVGVHPYSIYAKIIGLNDYGNNPKQLYKVYLAGQSLGIINSKEELEEYIDHKQDELKQKYNISKVYAPNDLKVMKEITYDKNISTVEDIYKKIEEIRGTSSFTIDGYKIFIEGLEKTDENEKIEKEDITFYVLDKEVFEKAVRNTVTAFVDSEKYDSYLNNTQPELRENETGSHIDNLYIANNIKITKGRIPAGDNIYTSETELSKLLLFGTTADQETYTVKSGDTIATIANNNKLSVEEFLIANTQFNSASDLLFTGQVVNLGLITPQFDLIEIETVAEERILYKETVYKNDDTQYIGYEKVEEEGSDGLALVTEKREITNGAITNTIPAGSTTITPAVPKVIVRGTKQQSYTPSGMEWDVPVGLGSWVWPTNAPYGISSGFGWRWGKLHEGIDINGPGYGSPIKAANNGVVVQSGYTGTNGNYIVIKHEDNYYTMYAHLASRTKQVGAVVMAGDLIGTMGKTGFATGVHLHFALYRGYPYRGGVATNPYTVYR